jgi:hypothetical protein
MSVRRLAALVLVALLAAPPMAPVAAAAAQPPSAGALQVEVIPARACVVAGEYPLFEGTASPGDGVVQARLFFNSALSNEFYYVMAVREGRGWRARAPRPRLEAGPFSFYFEASKGDFSSGRSLEGTAVVVRKIEECPSDRKAAPVAPGGPVSVFDVAGSPAFPAGFEGITGAGAATAGVGTAAGSGGFFRSTAGLITLGAIAVGVTTIVIATNGNEAKSGSR